MTGPDGRFVAEIERLVGGQVEALARATGGNAQETWLVTLAGPPPRRLVVRRSSPGSMSFTSRRDEFAVLQSLVASGLPVPAPIALSPDGSWLATELLPGGPVRRLDPGTRHAIGGQLGMLLARLHRRDATGTTSVDATRSELARWRHRWERCRVEAPILDGLLAWLERNLPSRTRPAVQLWGDPGPHNLLVDGDRISGLLDWELAHLGDPLDDLGAAVWACFDQLDADDVVEAWQTGVDEPVEPDLLDYFVVLACVTRSVISLLGVEALLAGTTRAVNLAGLGLALTTANLQRAAGLAWKDADAVASGSAASPTPRLAAGAPAEWLRPTGPELVAIVDAARAEAAPDDRRTALICEALTATIPTLPVATDDVSAWSRTARAVELCDADGERAAVRAALRVDLAHQRRRIQPLLDLYGPLVR